ncbi:glycoside hydrolase family 31 protein [Paenibacillus hunanensis]|uniref:glycoside hydrolase family 31 protein n=1 Tax=Paenibacillus hunanensis TaxID=539262 RepID=UPI002A6B36A9|nr:glycoside hydrolase family 31 protein [Paenibacillus hunanensis]WPP42739.1 glycoside hydrolase family 31 protein [Paenibacillus hunanensis]
MIHAESNRLIFEYANEYLVVEPWLQDSIRVRSTMYPQLQADAGALLELPAEDVSTASVRVKPSRFAYLTNGNITAVLDPNGKLTFLNREGEILLEEYNRSHQSTPKETDEETHFRSRTHFNSALRIAAREFKPLVGGDYSLTMRFEAADDERIYGMGQYQQDILNVKHCTLELAHRNSQASVPFALSSRGYGFLWNNPAIGEVTFGKNRTEWHALSTKQLDYWITAGDTPAAIVERYADATGKVPMMPDYGMGFWQCKLRYRTQEELLHIAREYKRRELPIDVIVVDFFHWTKQGDFRFDPEYWPDPEGMVRELKNMGIELMVSVWPTIDKTSENFDEMREQGLLVRTERGVYVTMEFYGSTVFFDATNPKARAYVWDKVKQNYYDKGIRIFWLDEAEPEYTVYDFDNYRYYEGSNLQVGNKYPAMYSRTFYDGMKSENQEQIINLVRAAWAGSQRYGALVWSGDIDSSFASMRNQLAIGLNMGIAGIPWWTTDIGGFHGGDPANPSFRECLIRWFQFGVFCPVFRLHGDRHPQSGPIGPSGGGMCFSGADNEVWSFGEEAYGILSRYMQLREALRPYITERMQDAHEKGSPVIRPLFYDFPHDAASWIVEDTYMFGPHLLVAPILEQDQRTRSVYLPKGTDWTDAWSGTVHTGGQTITAEAPLHITPVYIRQSEAATWRQAFSNTLASLQSAGY